MSHTALNPAVFIILREYSSWIPYSCPWCALPNPVTHRGWNKLNDQFLDAGFLDAYCSAVRAEIVYFPTAQCVAFIIGCD